MDPVSGFVMRSYNRSVKLGKYSACDEGRANVIRYARYALAQHLVAVVPRSALRAAEASCMDLERHFKRLSRLATEVFMLTLMLLVAGFVLFVLAGIGVPSSRFNLIAFGLACWILTELLGHGGVH